MNRLYRFNKNLKHDSFVVEILTLLQRTCPTKAGLTIFINIPLGCRDAVLPLRRDCLSEQAHEGLVVGDDLGPLHRGSVEAPHPKGNFVNLRMSRAEGNEQVSQGGHGIR